MSSYETALSADPAVADLIGQELHRQQTTLQLIASENFTSPAVLAASGSVLTNKYSEGYPGRRYYGGNQIIDEVEDLARDRATALFGAEHANVQPHAGANANLAAYQALLEPGATILAMRLDHGGHLTHGSPASIVSKFWRFVSYGVTPASNDAANPGEVIDFDQVAHLAKTREAGPDRRRLHRLRPHHRPAALPGDRRLGRRLLHVRRRPPGRADRRRRPPEPGRRGRCRDPHHAQDPARPRAAAPSCAARTWPRRSTAPSSPASRAVHSSTSSPPRRWPSPRPPSPSSALRGCAWSRTPPPWPRRWPAQGFRLVSGGTDNHMLLVDLRPFDAELTGKEAQEVLDRAGITLQPQHDPRRSPLAVRDLRAAPGHGGRDDCRHGPRTDGARSPSWSPAPSRRVPTTAKLQPSAGRWPTSAPPSRPIPISWASPCPTSVGTAPSWPSPPW